MPHATLRNQISKERIIEKLGFEPLVGELTPDSHVAVKQVTLHSPVLAESREGNVSTDEKWTVDPKGVRRYFLLECLT